MNLLKARFVAINLHHLGRSSARVDHHFFQPKLNQLMARAEKVAAMAPVFITDRGKPAYVLLSIEAYERLTGEGHKNC
jgi:prevent-host-death family protein